MTGSRQGRIVLVELRDATDPEHGGRYTVKRYESEKAEGNGGTWRHVRITLRPENAEFRPIELKVDDEGGGGGRRGAGGGAGLVPWICDLASFECLL